MSKKQMKEERGITLVALVVTIIILLILAGVTINIALSENGVFHRAKNAADKYKVAQTNEQDLLTNLDKELDEYINGPLVTTITDTAHTDNKKVRDSLGNPLVIPSGFKYVEGTNVEEGIVIEDGEQNQFVWIPVSNIDGKGRGLIKTTDRGDVEITLGRYIFKNQYNGTQSLSDGTPKLVQSGSERANDVTLTFYSDSASWDYKESTNLVRENGGEGTEKLEEFVKSVENNHGYYLARYEAGKGDNSKPVSKEGPVWNDMTQSVALEVAQKMYEGKENYTSDLVNSYAWDTAIVYIQAMKKENENYANAYDGNGNLRNTGATGDEKCHIFDMSGNVSEWTTEYCTHTNNSNKYPCVYRGCSYFVSHHYTAFRGWYNTTDSIHDIGFRPLLYLK